MITLTDVRKTYGSEVTIGPVDLEIPAGGVTALVGPNGAGKSTLLTMIGRLLDLDEGSIEVAGYDVASTKSKDLAKIVSILRQENHFITRLTVRQLVGFVVLSGAYFVMKHVFYAQGVVSIIIELVGGSVFLIVILRKGRL